MDSLRMQRIMQEAVLTAARYSQTHRAKVDTDAGRWVVIYDFPLPSGYNYSKTDILILLPPNYPLTPPDWFYLDPGLRRRDGKPPHYFHEDIRKAPGIKGWAAGCLHIRSWMIRNDPLDGHSLLTVCQLIEDAFKRWLRQ